MTYFNRSEQAVKEIFKGENYFWIAGFAAVLIFLYVAMISGGQ